MRLQLDEDGVLGVCERGCTSSVFSNQYESTTRFSMYYARTFCAGISGGQDAEPIRLDRSRSANESTGRLDDVIVLLTFCEPSRSYASMMDA